MELTFRLLSLGVTVAYMTTRTVYERRLHRPSKRKEFDRTSLSDRIALSVAAFGMLPMWLYMLSPWLDFAAMGLPAAVRLAGLAASAFGVFLLAGSHGALQQNWSPLVERPPGGTVVTTGVYRFVRHPMYASFLVFNAGIWLLTSNWVAGVPAVLGMLWLYFQRVDAEERMMLESFGEEYRAYAERTSRLIPGIGRGRLAGGRSSVVDAGGDLPRA